MNALQVMSFRGAKSVRVFGTHDNPLFLAADVCECLGLSDVSRAVSRLDGDDTTSIRVIDSVGRTQDCIAVNESGLYALVLGSRKPEAKAFKRWVTSEVLPAIRLTGRYEIQEETKRLAFAHFLAEIPAAYRTAFPDDWFEAVLGIWDLEYVKARTPGFVGKFINQYVYDALLEGLPEELKARREACGSDTSKLHQFLMTEAKDRLHDHLIATKSIALNCQGRPDDFKEAFDRVFRGRNQLLLKMGAAPKRRRIAA